MKQLAEAIKRNIKIIFVVVIIAVLAAAVWFINSNGTSASTVSTEKTATEIKLGGILSSIDGVGDTDVMIYESDEVISGVVIVCSGGNNIMVRNNILNAVSTALNIDKKIIAIYAMSD